MLVPVMQRWPRQADFLPSPSLHYGGRRPATKKINLWQTHCGGRAERGLRWIRRSGQSCVNKSYLELRQDGEKPPLSCTEWRATAGSRLRPGMSWDPSKHHEEASVAHRRLQGILWGTAFERHLSILNSTTLWLHTAIIRGSRCVTWGTDPGDAAGGISSYGCLNPYPTIL